MGSPSSQSGPSAYLESLMRAGQEATKHFDDALTAAMGVVSKPAKGEEKSPIAVTANLQHMYWSPILDFWRGFLGGKPAANAIRLREHREAIDASRMRPGATRLTTIFSSNPICRTRSN